MKKLLEVCFLPLLLFFLSTPLWAEPSSSPLETLPYSVRFEGYSNKTQLAMLERVSKLITLKEKLPETIYGIKRRAEEDLPHFQQTLEADGYYQAHINYEVTAREKETEVVIKINLGPRYLLKEVHLQSTPPLPLLQQLQDQIHGQHEILGISLNQPAIEETIKNLETLLLTYLKNNGYPFANIKDRHIVVNYLTQSMEVTFEFVPGPFCTFGPLTIKGLTTIDPAFVKGKINWKEGEVYNDHKIKEVVETLKNTGLFLAVRLEPQKPLANARLP